MIVAIIGLLILVLACLPQWWVRRTLRRYGTERADMPGTGNELAEHLIERFGLDVSVQRGGPHEDYYDPEKRLVSLSPDHYDGRSVTAVAVATHEVGHALQHHHQDPRFMNRQKRIRTAQRIERFSTIAIMATPLLPLLTKLPHTALVTVLLALAGMLAATWVQLMTLPVELDASFNRALPILEEGYLSPDDMPGARRVLRAAAYTYLAATLTSLLNVGRWIAILRR